MRLRLTGAILCAATLLFTGCALRLPGGGGPPQAYAGDGALSDYMAKIRHLSARPIPGATNVATVEAFDPVLAGALAALAASPSPARHRAVAERYRTLGLLDDAYRHFTSATIGDPFDAAAFDGLARVWRDWGLPHLGLGDAQRAAFHAPESATAHNTLGTVLQALAFDLAAQQAYERAIVLDAHAAYAVNNLCYLQFRRGEAARAIATCEDAVAIDPSLRAAHNNLALAQAAAGRHDAAAATLARAPQAEGLFNLGILQMARRDFARAASTFDAASRSDPSLTAAHRRAEQARDLAYRASRTAARTRP